jgi:hypothetical protein
LLYMSLIGILLSSILSVWPIQWNLHLLISVTKSRYLYNWFSSTFLLILLCSFSFTAP